MDNYGGWYNHQRQPSQMYASSYSHEQEYPRSSYQEYPRSTDKDYPRSTHSSRDIPVNIDYYCNRKVQNKRSRSRSSDRRYSDDRQVRYRERASPHARERMLNEQGGRSYRQSHRPRKFDHRRNEDYKQTDLRSVIKKKHMNSVDSRINNTSIEDVSSDEVNTDSNNNGKKLESFCDKKAQVEGSSVRDNKTQTHVKETKVIPNRPKDDLPQSVQSKAKISNAKLEDAADEQNSLTNRNTKNNTSVTSTVNAVGSFAQKKTSSIEKAHTHVHTHKSSETEIKVNSECLSGNNKLGNKTMNNRMTVSVNSDDLSADNTVTKNAENILSVVHQTDEKAKTDVKTISGDQNTSNASALPDEHLTSVTDNDPVKRLITTINEIQSKDEQLKAIASNLSNAVKSFTKPETLLQKSQGRDNGNSANSDVQPRDDLQNENKMNSDNVSGVKKQTEDKRNCNETQQKDKNLGKLKENEQGESVLEVNAKDMPRKSIELKRKNENEHNLKMSLIVNKEHDTSHQASSLKNGKSDKRIENVEAEKETIRKNDKCLKKSCSKNEKSSRICDVGLDEKKSESISNMDRKGHQSRDSAKQKPEQGKHEPRTEEMTHRHINKHVQCERKETEVKKTEDSIGTGSMKKENNHSIDNKVSKKILDKAKKKHTCEKEKDAGEKSKKNGEKQRDKRDKSISTSKDKRKNECVSVESNKSERKTKVQNDEGKQADSEKIKNKCALNKNANGIFKHLKDTLKAQHLMKPTTGTGSKEPTPGTDSKDTLANSAEQHKSPDETDEPISEEFSQEHINLTNNEDTMDMDDMEIISLENNKQNSNELQEKESKNRRSPSLNIQSDNNKRSISDDTQSKNQNTVDNNGEPMIVPHKRRKNTARLQEVKQNFRASDEALNKKYNGDKRKRKLNRIRMVDDSSDEDLPESPFEMTPKKPKLNGDKENRFSKAKHKLRVQDKYQKKDNYNEDNHEETDSRVQQEEVVLNPDIEILPNSTTFISVDKEVYKNGFKVTHEKVLVSGTKMATIAFLDPKKLYLNQSSIEQTPNLGKCLTCMACGCDFTPLGFTAHHDDSAVLKSLDQDKSMLQKYRVRGEKKSAEVDQVFRSFQQYFEQEMSQQLKNPPVRLLHSRNDMTESHLAKVKKERTSTERDKFKKDQPVLNTPKSKTCAYDSAHKINELGTSSTKLKHGQIRRKSQEVSRVGELPLYSDDTSRSGCGKPLKSRRMSSKEDLTSSSYSITEKKDGEVLKDSVKEKSPNLKCLPTNETMRDTSVNMSATSEIKTLLIKTDSNRHENSNSDVKRQRSNSSEHVFKPHEQTRSIQSTMLSNFVSNCVPNEIAPPMYNALTLPLLNASGNSPPVVASPYVFTPSPPVVASPNVFTPSLALSRDITHAVTLLDNFILAAFSRDVSDTPSVCADVESLKIIKGVLESVPLEQQNQQRTSRDIYSHLSPQERKSRLWKDLCSEYDIVTGSDALDKSILVSYGLSEANMELIDENTN